MALAGEPFFQRRQLFLVVIWHGPNDDKSRIAIQTFLGFTVAGIRRRANNVSSAGSASHNKPAEGTLRTIPKSRRMPTAISPPGQ